MILELNASKKSIVSGQPAKSAHADLAETFCVQCMQPVSENQSTPLLHDSAGC